MTILTLLQDILGPYKSHAKGENYFACPFCHNTKHKFAVNEHNLKWHCWHCGSKGGHILWLLKKLNLSKDQISKFKEVLGDEDIRIYKQTDAQIILQLPPEYKPLWKKNNSYPYLHAISYLKERGIGVEQILRYKMGYCEKGTYAGRIIIPSYDENNQLNYFTGRSFYEGGMKYKNPPVSKNVVVFENFIDWEEPIILCEGMFDAIALRQNAIPLMGKTLPKKLEQKILEKKVKVVYIFLDIDAKKEALNLEQYLKQYDIDTKLVLTDGKDASELGFENAWKAISESKTTNFTEFIKQRLFDK
jgi:DNA primase